MAQNYTCTSVFFFLFTLLCSYLPSLNKYNKQNIFSCNASSSNFNFSRIFQAGGCKGDTVPLFKKKLSSPRHPKNANSGYLNHIIEREQNFFLALCPDFCKKMSLSLCLCLDFRKFEDNWKQGKHNLSSLFYTSKSQL